MSLIKKVTISGREFTARELTVAELRQYLHDAKGIANDAAEIDVLGAVLLEQMTIFQLLRLCDATAEEVEKMSPSDLSILADACREVNRVFFATWDRLSQKATPNSDPGT